VYFGLSAGLQLLDVASFSLTLHRNEFTRCFSVIVGFGGNAYGGGVSIYIGGYNSSRSFAGSASASVGDTTVRSASVSIDRVNFTSCSASSTAEKGSNAYGGSFAFYVGAYAWSFSNDSSRNSSSSSSSASGLTSASGVNVSISHVNSSDCSAVSTGEFYKFGANSFGGSISVAYIGAYAWSFAAGSSSSSSSVCGASNVTGLMISISSSTFNDSSAASRTFCNNRLLSLSFAHSPSTRAESIPGASLGSNVSVLRSTTPRSYCHCARDVL